MIKIVSLPEFLNLISHVTIVIINNGGWSKKEIEIIKSLDPFIMSQKKEYSWISWRSKSQRVVTVSCDNAQDICLHYHKSKQENKILVFTGRHEDQYEVYHGEITHSGITKFAREVISAHIFQVNPRNHKELRSDGSEWFYDFSAPWCPPCRNFLPHIRYVSQSMKSKNIKFAYFDCQAYKVLFFIFHT